jgi:hypothetical protein
MKRTAHDNVVAVVSDPAANRSIAVTHSCSSAIGIQVAILFHFFDLMFDNFSK